MWACFVCGDHDECEHREHELVIWVRRGMRARSPAPEAVRIPPAREEKESIQQMELWPVRKSA